MRVSLHVAPDVIFIQARAESPGIVGDLFQDVRPGESFLGWTFEDLTALGTGGHDLEPRPAAQGESPT